MTGIVTEIFLCFKWLYVDFSKYILFAYKVAFPYIHKQ